MIEPGYIPPQDVNAEEIVLGTMLFEDEARAVVREELGSDSAIFYKPAHRHIYDSILSLMDGGDPVDIGTVETDLRKKSVLDVAGGPAAMADLTRSAASPDRMEYYCKVLAQMAVRRDAITANTQAVKELFDTTTDTYQVIDNAQTAYDKLSDVLYRKGGSFVSDMLTGVLQEIEDRKNSGQEISGVPSGYAIDKYTGGWQPGELYILAARPSIGKTAFILNGSFNAALMAGAHRTTVMYFNMEMKNYDLIKRRLAVESGVNYIKMRDGKVSDQDIKDLVDAAGRMFEGRFILDDASSPHINEVRAKVKSAVRRHGVGLVVVDYLQLMSGKTDGLREQEISSIARGLKACAKENNIPIVAAAQLSRQCENRPGAEPFLSDIRESGALEQEADGVILLNRPEFFGHKLYRNQPTEGRGWVKIAKMRNGMTGEFTMNFQKKLALWTNEASSEIPRQGNDSAPVAHSIGDNETPF